MAKRPRPTLIGSIAARDVPADTPIMAEDIEGVWGCYTCNPWEMNWDDEEFCYKCGDKKGSSDRDGRGYIMYATSGPKGTPDLLWACSVIGPKDGSDNKKVRRWLRKCATRRTENEGYGDKSKCKWEWVWGKEWRDDNEPRRVVLRLYVWPKPIEAEKQEEKDV